MTKQIHRIGTWAMVAILSVWFGGCATAEKAPEAAPVEDKTAAPAGAETAGVGEAAGPVGGALPAGERAGLLAKRRVHFAFDSSTVDEEGRSIIEAHAAHLAANPQIKVRLEGHCDERGSREYNLALGERRAQSVERLMRVLGIPSSRLVNATYGEEKPLDPEHNESAWRLNRRVEIIY